MSCPYFDPVEPRTHENDRQFAMLPLGDLWAGVCRAVPECVWQPEEALVHQLCHLGYARGGCARFPAEDPGPDAVRFSITRRQEGSLHLDYVLERDHHPFAQGRLEYSLARDQFVDPPGDEIVCRQAQAYVTSYLRWVKKAVR